MKIVVVCESLYGNTKTIAEAIAEGLRESGEVRSGSVDEIAPEETSGADLIVAGGPTHAHGMARRGAHEAVAKMDEKKHKYGPVLPGDEALRDWLDRIPDGTAAGAAFDTRFDKPKWLTGSAAKKIARLLGRKGYPVIAEESFFVATTGGPLANGERERAVAWGRSLAAGVKTTAAA